MLRPTRAALLFTALCAGRLAAQHPDRNVGGVSFKGNHALDGDALAAAISTTPSSWTYRLFHLGERRGFDELEFRRDVVRLQFRQHFIFFLKTRRGNTHMRL